MRDPNKTKWPAQSRVLRCQLKWLNGLNGFLL